jgi:hypothetical protein
MVADGEIARFTAGAEGVHRRQRLLQRLWPHRHGAILEMPSLPAEGLRFLPGSQDQLQALVGALTRFLGVEVIGQHLVGGAAQHADDQPALGHRVEHRHFLSEQYDRRRAPKRRVSKDRRAPAKFAPVWRETDLAAPELAPVRNALDRMMAQQEPFPAVAVDRRWNLLRANQAAGRLVEFLVGPLASDARVNLADALVGPDVLRPFLINWADVVGYFVRSVETDAIADGTPETAALLERLLSYEGVRPLLKAAVARPDVDPALAMHFRKGDISLELFSLRSGRRET